ncbi:hypothetical protein M1D72_14650 [Vibrio sp. AK197]
MNKDIKTDFNLGGTIETALSGQYELKVGSVLKEAWQQTIKHFVSFSPAIIVLLALQALIFYIALKLQLGDLGIIVDSLSDPEAFNQNVVQAIVMANFSYEVVSAPIYAGICLMAMSHAAGLKTQLKHISKGLQFTVPVIIVTLIGLVIQILAGMLLPFLSLYFSLAFSNTILLICEKNIPPMQALLLSLRAANKKLLTLAGVYFVILVMFVIAAMFYGIGLIFVLPFFFHAKGVIYRNMFGIRLKIVSTGTHKGSGGDDDNNNSQVFNA